MIKKLFFITVVATISNQLYAAEEISIEQLKHFVDFQVNVSFNNVDYVKKLLTEEPGLVEQAETYLYDHYIISEPLLDEAIIKKHTEMALLLIENGAKIVIDNHHNGSMGNPLALAILRQQFPVVQSILEHGVKPDKPIYLDIALTLSDDLCPSYLLLLLKYGADPNQIIEKKPILFHSFRSLEALKLLVRYGANINIKNENGESPLELAICLNRPDIVKLLKKTAEEKRTRERIKEQKKLSAIAKTSFDSNIKLLRLWK